MKKITAFFAIVRKLKSLRSGKLGFSETRHEGGGGGSVPRSRLSCTNPKSEETAADRCRDIRAFDPETRLTNGVTLTNRRGRRTNPDTQPPPQNRDFDGNVGRAMRRTARQAKRAEITRSF